MNGNVDWSSLSPPLSTPGTLELSRCIPRTGVAYPRRFGVGITLSWPDDLRSISPTGIPPPARIATNSKS
jgi:hypothetical protein